MKNLTWTALLAASWFVFLGVQPACAQGIYVRPQTNPYGLPAVSPYINLGRGGGAAINYFGLVRPQIDNYTNLQQLQQAQALDAQNLSLLNSNALNATAPITGMTSQFMNFSHYYGTRISGPGTMQQAIQPRAIMPPLNLAVNRGR